MYVHTHIYMMKISVKMAKSDIFKEFSSDISFFIQRISSD